MERAKTSWHVMREDCMAVAVGAKKDATARRAKVSTVAVPQYDV